MNGRRTAGRTMSGQAMVEFALIIGLFMLVVGGVIQFGMILWSQNTVTSIARDTARRAVTVSSSPCDSSSNRAAIAGIADQIATGLSLVAHPSGSWSTATAVSAVGASGVGVDWPIPARPTDIPPGEWPTLFPTDCPAADNRIPWTVAVRVNHVVPIFIPGLQFIAPPCGANGFCISSTTELRMEPKAP